MDEKTEELRDIFLDVADDATLTEPQRDARGSLGTDRDVNDALRDIIADMRDHHEFESGLDDEALITIAQGCYDGIDDSELAEELGTDTQTIRRARFDLHLIREAEREAPFDRTAAVRAAADDTPVEVLAARFEVDESTVRFHLRIHDIERRSRQVNQRFRDAFDTVLADADLSRRMVREVHEDGLEDATEGLESNVSF